MVLCIYCFCGGVGDAKAGDGFDVFLGGECLGVFIIVSFLGYSLYDMDHLERDIS